MVRVPSPVTPYPQGPAAIASLTRPVQAARAKAGTVTAPPGTGVRDCGAAAGRTREGLGGPSNEAVGGRAGQALRSGDRQAASSVGSCWAGPDEAHLGCAHPKNSLRGVTGRTESLWQGTALAAPWARASRPAGSWAAGEVEGNERASSKKLGNEENGIVSPGRLNEKV